MDHFTLAPAEYMRDLNIFEAYVAQSALYLQKCTGKALEVCEAFVRKTVSKDGVHPMRDPDVAYLSSETRGNRARQGTTFTGYVQHAVIEEMPMGPNMTAYLPIKVKQSMTAVYINGNMKLRSGYKHAQLESKQRADTAEDSKIKAGHKAKEKLFKNLQTTCKIKNNSVSGAHASPYNPLYCKSAHSSLTSVCRISTSYANACNERLLAGNRHYWCPDIVYGYILSTISNTDYDVLQQVIDQYQIHLPTTAEVMACIEYSTINYWHDPFRLARIEYLVERLRPIERAAVMYTADMYHLGKYNPETVRQFLLALSAPSAINDPNAAGYLKKSDGELTQLAKMLCSDLINGQIMSDLKEAKPNDYGIIETTARDIQVQLDSYASFIAAFLRPMTLPTSINAIPTVIRRVVATSDTDSTIFTTQYWTRFITGSINFSKQSNAIRDTVTYIVAKTVKHNLAMMSANIGIDVNNRNTIEMKNEYVVPLFGLTAIAKHYMQLIAAQEGNVFKEMEFDVKGVNLRSSNAPAEVTQLLREWMHSLFKKYMAEGSISIHDLLGPIAKLENDIVADIRKGGYRFLKSAQTHDADSYKNGEDATALQYYRFWNDVYGTTFGECPPPPFATVKVSLALGNKTAVTKWLSNMQDRVIADKIKAWMVTHKKDKLPSLQLPTEIIAHRGIPVEIAEVLELRKLVYNITHPFYLVLETFGIYMKTKNISRMVSDTYVPPAEGGADMPDMASIAA